MEDIPQWAVRMSCRDSRHSGCHATYVRKGAVHDGSIRVMLIQSSSGERGGWEMVQHQRRKNRSGPGNGMMPLSQTCPSEVLLRRQASRLAEQ